MIQTLGSIVFIFTVPCGLNFRGASRSESKICLKEGGTDRGEPLMGVWVQSPQQFSRESVAPIEVETLVNVHI